jgi:hypothetical protein
VGSQAARHKEKQMNVNGNRNSASAVLEHEGPRMLFIKKSQIPIGVSRGRVSFLSEMPFWSELLDILKNGLSPAEAIEIDLTATRTAEGKEISSMSLLSAIRHQFQKTELSKKYSLILRGDNTRLFITDHATAAHA